MSDAKVKPMQSVERCKYRHDWVKVADGYKQAPDGYICRKCNYAPKRDTELFREAEAILHLRSILKPSDTVYTVLRHVSRSGMSRGIDCYVMSKDGGEPAWITAYVGHAIGTPQSMEDWRKSRGLKVGGCGMDMGFHVVNSLSMVIFPEYKCLGKDGHCPSNYHVNHRDTVNCEGVPQYALYALDDAKVMQKQATFGTRAEAELAASLTPADRKPEVDSDYIRCWKSDTVKMPELEVEADGEMIKIPQGKAYTIRHDDGREEICPTCQGHGRHANPDGPECWDLMHTDGYALKHKWL